MRPKIIEAHKMGVGKMSDEPLAGVVFFDVHNNPVARLKLNADGCREIAKHLAYAAHDIEANDMPPAPAPHEWKPEEITLADIDLMVLRDIAARGIRTYSNVSEPYQQTIDGLRMMVPGLVSVIDDVVSVTEKGRQVLKAQA